VGPVLVAKREVDAVSLCAGIFGKGASSGSRLQCLNFVFLKFCEEFMNNLIYISLISGIHKNNLSFFLKI
jgi:hypothetical protein